VKNLQEILAKLTILIRQGDNTQFRSINVTTSTREPLTCAWIRADIWRQDGAIWSKNRKIVPYHGCARILRLTVSIPDYGSCWYAKYLLRSTKWNASLIFTCGFQELVTLCKVIFWKIHIPVRKPKWLPRLIFCRGMSQPVNWYRNYDTASKLVPYI